MWEPQGKQPTNRGKAPVYFSLEKEERGRSSTFKPSKTGKYIQIDAEAKESLVVKEMQVKGRSTTRNHAAREQKATKEGATSSSALGSNEKKQR